jgi:glycosyltransferase involved in cell wall biosynthesis
MMGERFSIAIPVWNDAVWLPGAIESVLAQSYPLWELVIGDNASDADLAAIAQRYPDARIRYHRWSTHTGPSENHNRTMALCRNEWVHVLSADDRIRPDCLERMAERVSALAGCGERPVMVVTACTRVPASYVQAGVAAGHQAAVPPLHYQRISDGLYDPAGWILANAATGVPPWMFGSVAIARDLLVEIGGFRPEMGLCHDLELAMRVAAYGSVAYIDEPLLEYTVREDSVTGRLVRERTRVGSSMVQLGTAWSSALRAHELRRVVSRAERLEVNAAIARAFLQRALLHRRAGSRDGHWRAILDVVRAACSSPRTVLMNWRGVVALGAILAPRWCIERATMFGHRHGFVVV